MENIPRALFLTKGVGRHRDKIVSFEMALRDAQIARLNLVSVSSIFPPHCELISRDKGLAELKDGQIVHSVISQCATNENRRLIVASVGLAIPSDRNMYGYLSEHHAFGENEEQAGDYSENMAATMLATILGLEFDPTAAWDDKKQIWKISGKIVKSTNVTQSAIGSPGNIWTTVVAAAIFVP